MNSFLYFMRLGPITDVLNGKGEPVLSVDSIYLVEEEKEFIIPKIIGVYQKDNLFESFLDGFGLKISDHSPEIKQKITDSLEMITVDTIQKILGRREGIPKDLISIIFDPNNLDRGLVRMYLGDKDPFSRISLFDSVSVPNYGEKISRDYSKIRSVVRECLENEQDREKKIAFLDKEFEEISLDKQNYGLTLFEALQYYDLKGNLSRFKNEKDLSLTPKNSYEAFMLLKIIRDLGLS